MRIKLFTHTQILMGLVVLSLRTWHLGMKMSMLNFVHMTMLIKKCSNLL